MEVAVEAEDISYFKCGASAVDCFRYCSHLEDEKKAEEKEAQKERSLKCTIRSYY